MNKTLFEQLHRDEVRHAEWRLLDEALATRSDNKQRVRVQLGHLLIKAGASLADEIVTAQPKPCCAANVE